MRFVSVLVAGFLITPAHALTFKSDGSVVQADGTVTQKAPKNAILKLYLLFVLVKK